MVESLRNALDVFFSYIPQLIGAIIILIVGYIVAKILQAVVSRVLKGVGFDGWMERGGIKQFLDRAQTRETPATVLIILGAVALAAAIAFGFGAQGVARDIVEKAYARRDEAKQTVQQGDSGRDGGSGGDVTADQRLSFRREV